MTEEGTLSIVMRENAYQVRYASNNPHTMAQLHHRLTTCLARLLASEALILRLRYGLEGRSRSRCKPSRYY